jgi:hypothetical protein
MKQEIKRQDAPKIAIGLALLLAIGSAGWMKMQGSASESEQARATLQAKRETGQRIEAGDENLSPGDLDEAENKRADADPNFRD